MESQGDICLSQTFWCSRRGIRWVHKGERAEIPEEEEKDRALELMSSASKI